MGFWRRRGSCRLCRVGMRRLWEDWLRGRYTVLVSFRQQDGPHTMGWQLGCKGKGSIPYHSISLSNMRDSISKFKHLACNVHAHDVGICLQEEAYGCEPNHGSHTY